MSNYPPDSYPPDPYRPEDYPPGSYPQRPGERDPFAPPPSQVSGRVVPPAVGLIVVAVLNVLISLYFIVSGILTVNMPDAQFEQQVTMFYSPEMKAKFQQQAGSLDTIRKTTLLLCAGGGGLGFVLSLLTLFGAVRMMALKSYGLAVFVSVLAAIPLISCSACCGIGEGIGIWALVVLLNPEVRSAFR